MDEFVITGRSVDYNIYETPTVSHSALLFCQVISYNFIVCVCMYSFKLQYKRFSIVLLWKINK